MASVLGLDIGDKRIGVAMADLAAPFASPLTTLMASPQLAADLKQLLLHHQVKAVVIGLPRNQKGERTAQTDRVEHIVDLLAIPAEIKVYWQDESLTSVKAEKELDRRKKPYAKADIDALAATYILEDFIQTRRNELTHLSGDSALPVSETTTQPAVANVVIGAKKPAGRLARRFSIAVGVLLLCVILAAGAVFGWYRQQLQPRTQEDAYAVVKIASGASVGQIADQLAEAKLIKSALAFEWYVKLHSGSSLQAGQYRLSSKQSVESIVNTLASGKVTTIDILISPGRRLDQIIFSLQKDGYAKAEIEAALVAVRDHPLLRDVPSTAPLEGFLFPDTYKVDPSTSAEKLLRVVLDNFQAKISSEITAGLAAQNLSLRQGIIIASIVQQEASDTKIQPTVAQVFLKRYQQGMALGSDVTALYGARVDNVQLPANPAQAAAIAIGHSSPYNTRRGVGLPPTAISNFNMAALKAVAQPSQTDYLYFVAGDDGVTYFSRTAAEHDALVKQHCITGCG